MKFPSILTIKNSEKTDDEILTIKTDRTHFNRKFEKLGRSCENNVKEKLNLKNILAEIKLKESLLKRKNSPKFLNQNLNEIFKPILSGRDLKTIKSPKKLFQLDIKKNLKIRKTSNNSKTDFYPKIESKKKYSLKKIVFFEKELKSKKTQFYLICNKEGVSMTKLNNKEVMIIGGKSHKVFKDIFKFNKDTFVLEKLKIDNYDKQIRFNRYGHTSHIINQKLYVIGGFCSNENIMNMKFELNKINNLFFEVDLQENVYSYDNYEDFPEYRKNHNSVLLDNFLVVFGGQNLNGEDLNDLWIFSTNYNKWIKLDLSLNTFPFLEKGISHHKMAVFQNEKKVEKILKEFDKDYFQKEKVFLSDEEVENFENKFKKNYFKGFNKTKLKENSSSSFINNLIVKNTDEKKEEQENPVAKIQISKNKLNKKKTKIDKTDFDYLKSFFLTNKKVVSVINKSKKNNKGDSKLFSKKNMQKSKIKKDLKKEKFAPRLILNQKTKQKLMNKLIVDKFINNLKKNLIILFGGTNCDFSKSDNNIRFLNYNKNYKKFFWAVLPVSQNSLQPPPRFAHSLHIIKNNLFLYAGIGNNSVFLSDFWIFDFKTFLWKNFDITGPLSTQRGFHSSELFNDIFVVFGGLTKDNYLSNYIYTASFISS